MDSADLTDAAHATSPQLGQGANLALIDAVTLSWAVKDFSAFVKSYGGLGDSLDPPKHFA
ncbi:MAG: FAD-dependent monooxygenase [Proteobacteria bacterium]|nr:FAD-dependent monooxygenase [Pseudomonadota bacterium]